MLDRSRQVPRQVRGATADGVTLALAALVAFMAMAGPVACGGDEAETARRERARSGPVTASLPEAAAARSTRATPASDTAARKVRTGVSYGEAETAFLAGDWREAVALFEAYAAEHPENPWGHYMLGLSAWKGGHAERAIAGFEAALARDPDHLKSLVNLSRVRLEAGQAEEASVAIERALAVDPGSGEAWRVAGNVRSELDDDAGALDAYRRAIALDDGDAWAMNNLGLLLIREGRYDEALGPLARATELEPEVGVFQNNLGAALERTGYLAEAADAFRAAVGSAEGSGKAEESLARVEARTVGLDAPPADLPGLALAFGEEIERWRSDLLAAAPAVEPGSEGTDESSVEETAVTPAPSTAVETEGD
ncbi:MAG: tetratricopeptide repeat protein [Gemmatimonadota bacterium]